MARIKDGKEKQMLMAFVCFEKSRKGLLSYSCSCVRCELNWNSVVLLLRRVEIQKTLRKTSRSIRDTVPDPDPEIEGGGGVIQTLRKGGGPVSPNFFFGLSGLSLV